MDGDYTARAKREAAAIIAEPHNRMVRPADHLYDWSVSVAAQAWLAGYRAALESLAERIEP